ncbi:hypothetical protein [Bradyrhizobium sp. 21]|uniref:hypothetical protein n=1 Tax=Bradyrhizobium sp. 21 TaxID=2782666 RepID=UPI001FFB04D3|nr:hypothetical protein [Bradyrhizobium sp. 21]MCK1385217.1 hypothetical protein [Bradyrhizobium sp. 21]
MSQPKKRERRWRVWSTAESIEQEEISIAAIIETFLATAVYLWIAAYVGFFLPLIVGLLTAPFVLLRTPYSLHAGILLARRYVRHFAEVDLWMLLFIGGPTAAVLGLYVLLKQSGVMSDLSTSALLPPLIGTCAAYVTASVVIRIWATVKFIRIGVQAMPGNFRKLWMCTSPSQLPELVPGFNQTNYFFSMGNVAARLKNGPDRSAALGGLIYLCLLFWPTWLLRFSVKSAFWFWWPVSYIGSDLREKPDILGWNSVGSLKAKASIISAIAVLSSFFFFNFLVTGAWLREHHFISPIGLLFNVEAPNPWQIPALAAAMISIVIVFLANDAAGRKAISTRLNDEEIAEKASKTYGWIERLSRLRLLAACTFWLLAAIQSVDYANNERCVVRPPDWVHVLLKAVYTPRFHKMTCEQYSVWNLFTNRDVARL